MRQPQNTMYFVLIQNQSEYIFGALRNQMSSTTSAKGDNNNDNDDVDEKDAKDDVTNERTNEQNEVKRKREE